VVHTSSTKKAPRNDASSLIARAMLPDRMAAAPRCSLAKWIVPVAEEKAQSCLRERDRHEHDVEKRRTLCATANAYDEFAADIEEHARLEKRDGGLG